MLRQQKGTCHSADFSRVSMIRLSVDCLTCDGSQAFSLSLVAFSAQYYCASSAAIRPAPIAIVVLEYGVFHSQRRLSLAPVAVTQRVRSYAAVMPTMRTSFAETRLPQDDSKMREGFFRRSVCTAVPSQ
jgi:hypothetical protein